MTRNTKIVYVATFLFIAGIFVGDGLHLAEENFLYLVGLTMQGLAVMALILISKD